LSPCNIDVIVTSSKIMFSQEGGIQLSPYNTKNKTDVEKNGNSRFGRLET